MDVTVSPTRLYSPRMSAEPRETIRPSDPVKSPISRTRTGCLTCRQRKIKCDESKPACSQCRRGTRSCEWPRQGDARRPRDPRRPNATACNACKEKKLKCIGELQDTCKRCHGLGLQCIRQSAVVHPENNLTGQGSASPRIQIDSPRCDTSTVSPGTDVPDGEKLGDLVALYFRSVHQFGFFAFIHQPQFNRLLAKGKAPRELTLMMIASAVRFAAEPSPDNLAKANHWADMAISATLPRIYQGFGVVQLMTLLLAQHYDLNRGNFTSAWILGANCARMMQMMSLQTLDRTYPAAIRTHLRLSQLISAEALRRVAWATFYLDSVIDGGRFGFQVVDETSYRVQLPCDEAMFMGNDEVITDTLFPNAPFSLRISTQPWLEKAPLGMSGYLLRIATARRRALYFAFRASHHESTGEALTRELTTLEADAIQVVNDLPRRFHFNSDNTFLHRDQLATFILMHVLRHNLFIIIGRAALQVYPRDASSTDLIPQVRRNRVSHAQSIAAIFAQGLAADVVLDPQLGVQAYVTLEILLFEPRRLAQLDFETDANEADVNGAIPHLLQVIRKIALRSEFVRQLHIEAVHRLLRFGHSALLNRADIEAFHSEYRFAGQDDAEYDFRDFRWAKLERLRRGTKSPANATRDEALLEYDADEEIAAASAMPSPRLDAIHVDSVFTRPTEHSPNLPDPSANSGTAAEESLPNIRIASTGNPFLGHIGFETADQDLSLDWSWDLGESGYPGHQTGDPEVFWNQL